MSDPLVLQSLALVDESQVNINLIEDLLQVLLLLIAVSLCVMMLQVICGVHPSVHMPEHLSQVHAGRIVDCFVLLSTSCFCLSAINPQRPLRFSRTAPCSFFCLEYDRSGSCR